MNNRLPDNEPVYWEYSFYWTTNQVTGQRTRLPDNDPFSILVSWGLLGWILAS